MTRLATFSSLRKYMPECSCIVTVERYEETMNTKLKIRRNSTTPTMHICGKDGLLEHRLEVLGQLG